MTKNEMGYQWTAGASKPKTLTVSEMIHNREAGIPYNPGDLRDYLVQRMMAKDRKDRFQTPEEVIAQIEENAGDVSDAVRKGPAPVAAPVAGRRASGRKAPVKGSGSTRGKAPIKGSVRKKPRGRRGRRR